MICSQTSTIEKLKKILEESYSFPSKGYKLPNTTNDKNISNQRILETDLIYLIGIPNEKSSLNILNKYENLGQYGKIIEYHAVKNQITATSSTSALFIRFSSNVEASLAILGLVIGKTYGIKTFFGTNKYCSYFVSKKTCPNKKCLFMHKLISDGHYFYKDGKIEEEYHYKLAFSILMKYKTIIKTKYQELINQNECEKLNYPSIIRVGNP